MAKKDVLLVVQVALIVAVGFMLLALANSMIAGSAQLPIDTTRQVESIVGISSMIGAIGGVVVGASTLGVILRESRKK